MVWVWILLAFPSSSVCRLSTSDMVWVWILLAFPSSSSCKSVTSPITWLWISDAAPTSDASKTTEPIFPLTLITFSVGESISFQLLNVEPGVALNTKVLLISVLIAISPILTFVMLNIDDSLETTKVSVIATCGIIESSNFPSTLITGNSPAEFP